MKGTRPTRYSAELNRRRERIELTLRHLENERRQVEANTEWASRDAYESRVKLLRCLTDWCWDEITHVDAAIRRSRAAGPGCCAACYRVIEPARLAGSPGAQLCAECEAIQEQTQ